MTHWCLPLGAENGSLSLVDSLRIKPLRLTSGLPPYQTTNTFFLPDSNFLIFTAAINHENDLKLSEDDQTIDHIIEPQL